MHGLNSWIEGRVAYGCGSVESSAAEDFVAADLVAWSPGLAQGGWEKTRSDARGGGTQHEVSIESKTLSPKSGTAHYRPREPSPVHPSFSFEVRHNATV